MNYWLLRPIKKADFPYGFNLYVIVRKRKTGEAWKVGEPGLYRKLRVFQGVG